MKKTFFLMLLCAGSSTLFAQQNMRNHQPPKVVEQSYQKSYSNYNHQDWDMKNNQWHTRYTDKDHDNRAVDVYYDKRGRRLKSQSAWNRNDLPAPVRDRMKKRYHSDNYEAYRVERPGKSVYFQISLGGNKLVYMDERGREVRP